MAHRLLPLALPLLLLAPAATAAGNPAAPAREAIVLRSAPAEAGRCASPLSLAAGDFDGDGIPDLASGCWAGGAGLVRVHRGNPESIFPRRPGRNAAEPFFVAGRAIELPTPPDRLGTGDFDADGNADLVVATIGDDELRILRGDGQGGFAAPESIRLDGRLTALAVADVNRPDLLADLLAGVDTPAGPALLVFEGERGALGAEPERIALPAAATGIAAGAVDDHFPLDVAVATGRGLLLVHGRDRHLWREDRSAATALVVERFANERELLDVAIGDFGDPAGNEIALLAADRSVRRIDRTGQLVSVLDSTSPGVTNLLAARLSGGSGNDLLLFGPNAPLVLASAAEPAEGRSERPIPWRAQHLPEADGAQAVLPMRLGVDGLDDLVVARRDAPAPIALMTPTAFLFTVNSGGDQSDALLSDDACDVDLGTPLNQCTFRAAIEQANWSVGADTIQFAIGSGNVTLAPASAYPNLTQTVTIDATTQPGGRIELNGTAAGPITAGLRISSTSCVVRGLVINRFGQFGIWVDAAAAKIEGNSIGTDLAGTSPLPNGSGGLYNPSTGGGTTIGGSAAGAGNVISGNYRGIYSMGSSVSIQGNILGLDASGASPIPNTAEGIYASNGTITIGGSAPNVISGNGGSGIVLVGATGTIAGNLIGTDATGQLDRGNGTLGVTVVGACTVGGTAAAAGNTISGNESGGIAFEGSDGVARGNRIGTNATATTTIANWLYGIRLNGNCLRTTIGGAVPGAGNVISGNFPDGLWIPAGARDGEIKGNRIGTDATGTVGLGNLRNGIGLEGEQNVIGGPTEGSRNVISGNGWAGIAIAGAGAFENVVAGNFIGTAADGTTPLGNGQGGVQVTNGASANRIGGTVSEGNTVAGNSGIGIWVNAGSGNRISANRIFANGTLGIDLGSMGVLPNDAGDGDTGANQLQNYPVLSAVTRGSGTLVEGTLDSRPDATYVLEFFSNAACDPWSRGEGELFLGSAVVATDPSGLATFSVTIPTLVPAGRVIAATATDSDDNTSEFSGCTAVLDPPGFLDPSLRAAERGSDIDLTWNPSSTECGASDFAVYEGSLALLETGTFDHANRSCATGRREWSGTMPAFDAYYLVTVLSPTREGSYGKSSDGIEHPTAAVPCGVRLISSCP